MMDRSALASSRGLILWILCLHIVGVYIFTTGFFLTRFEVTSRSDCANPPGRFATGGGRAFRGEPRTESSSKASCWSNDQKFKKAIILIIDALRYDFAATSETDGESDAQQQYFLNHLPVFQETMLDHPDRALLYKFRADPPTMTMQRLKGLTTGGLPTFMDFKDNMHSSEIVEDSIIQQIGLQGRNIVFMGDNTWDQLYSKYFQRNYSFDSFNVKDLHTVDNGVVDNLFPEMHKRDWDVIIGHFLGVDHVGHTFGPSDPHMEAKLIQMNDILKKAIQKIDDDTLLIVMGDHGMSPDGNHGGATSEETDAALFLYSKRPLHESSENSSTSFQAWASGKYDSSLPPQYSVSQVDLVPTLSLLLGLPIPFGNLGSVIPELFFVADKRGSELAHENKTLSRFKSLVNVLETNVHQVKRYFEMYSRIARIPTADSMELQQQYRNLQQLFNERHSVSTVPEQIAHEAKLTHALQMYLKNALDTGRRMWTQFDVVQMLWGLVILILSLISIPLILVRHFRTELSSRFGTLGAILCTTCVLVLCSSHPATTQYLPSDGISRFLVVFFVPSQVVFILSSLRHAIRVFVHYSWSFPSAVHLIAFVTVLLHALGLLSNSFIVAEEQVFIFLSATVGFSLCALGVKHCPEKQMQLLLFFALFIIPSRISTLIAKPNIIYTNVTLVRTVIPFIITPVLLVALEKRQQSRTCSTLRWIFIASCYIFTMLYWMADASSSEILRLLAPRYVYLTGAIGVVSSLCDANVFGLVAFACAPFMLVLGPTSPLSILCCVVQLSSLAAMMRAITSLMKSTCVPFSCGLLWSIVANQWFFGTGHACGFAQLQNACAFVGFDEFNFYIAGMLLFFNTFGSFLISTLAISGVVLPTTAPWIVVSMAYACVAYFTLNGVVTSIFVAIQRRHLMVWAIFAPKYLFDAVCMIVVDVAVCAIIFTRFYAREVDRKSA